MSAIVDVTQVDTLIDAALTDDVQILDKFLQEGGIHVINEYGYYDRTALMQAAAWDAHQSVALLIR